jgi:antitoxin FitA
MGNIQVKNVPEDLHEQLRRRATAEGTTVRDYVLGLIRRDLALPSKAEWFARLATDRPVEHVRPAAQVIAEERAKRDRR